MSRLGGRLASGRLASGLASAGPIGHAGPAPGTVASALAVLSGAALMRCSPRALPMAALLSLPVGWLAIGRTQVGADPDGADPGGTDPGWVVIDEIAGQWIAMLGLRRTRPADLLACFAAFRLLDIVKPGPVGWIDRRRGPLAVMGDDVAAGILAALLLFAMGRRRR